MQTWARHWAPEHAHCSFRATLRYDASQYAYCTIGTRIRASWLVSGRNICSLRSLIDWLVATHIRLITQLYQHRIHSIKFYVADRLKKSKVLNNEHTKSLYSPGVAIFFPQMQKSLLLQPKEFIRFLCEFVVNFLKRNPQSKKKTSREKVSKQILFTFCGDNHLEATERRSGSRKRVTIYKSFYSCCH